MNSYLRVKKIARSTNGDIILAQRKYDGKPVAIKMLHKSNNSDSSYEAEVTILRSLRHPNIIKYYDSFIDQEHQCIAMEYAENCDLRKLIENKKFSHTHFNDEQIENIFCEVLLATHYIHSKGVLHRDIKASNVFLSKSNQCKLGDFGISALIIESNTFCIGTPAYTPPEVCLGKEYSVKSDMWMLGCLLFELNALKQPFAGNSYSEIVSNIVNQTPLLPPTINVRFVAIITQLLDKDPDRRPTTSDIIINITIANTISLIQISADYNDCRVHPKEILKQRLGYFESSLELVHSMLNTGVKSKPPNINTSICNTNPVSATSKAFLAEQLIYNKFKTPSPANSKVKYSKCYNISDLIELDEYLRAKIGEEKTSLAIEYLIEHKNDRLESCVECLTKIVGDDSKCISIIKKAWSKHKDT